MTRRVGKAWPVVLSLAGHGIALAALAYFFAHAGPAGRPATTPQIGLDAPRLDPPSLEDVAPPASRDVRFTGSSLPEPRLPDVKGEDEVVLPSEEVASLPPLQHDEPDWVVIDVPLSVARRRIERLRVPSGAPAPAAPAPRPTARPPQARGAAPRPPPLKPVHAPHYYPREALRQRLEGRALVEVTVHTSGTVMGTRLLASSGHDVLDRAALASARQWRFARIPRTRKAAIPFRFGP